MRFDHVMRPLVSLGAKSHAAAGFAGAERRMDMVSSRSAPQQMKPTPTGRISGGVFGIGFCCREVEQFSRMVERVLTSVPAPMKPMPSERETARVRSSCAMRRMGAQVMRGLAVHG